MLNIGIPSIRTMRRFRRSGRKRNHLPGITHVPSTMNNTLLSNSSTTVILCHPGILAGAALTTPSYTNANREQEVPLGAIIGKTVSTILAKAATAQGVLEFTLQKVERADALPAAGGVLGTDAEVITLGLEATDRQHQPGRIIYYGARAYAPEQTLVHKAIGRWSKYKMAKVRQGDHYLLRIFNRSSGTIDVSISTLYKAYA